MTERRLSTLCEAATQLLDTLVAGRGVTLEITAQDEASGVLLCLIAEIHQTAEAQQLAITMRPMGERGLRLTLAEG